MADKVAKILSEISEADLRRKLPSLLSYFLPDAKIQKVEAEVTAGPVVVDLKATVKVGRVRKVLLFEVKGKGEPKYLLNAIGSLTIAGRRTPEAYPIVFVPSLSKEGRSLLREAGIGYVSMEGEVYIKFDTVYVDRQGGPRKARELFQAALEAQLTAMGQSLQEAQRLIENAGVRQRPRKKLGFPYSPKASRVIRAMLERPKQSWTILGLAREANVALRLVLLVVNALDSKGYVRKQRGDIRLLKRKDLLGSWAEQYEFREVNDLYFCYSLARDFDEFKRRLTNLPPGLADQYGLTMFAGASLIAPQLRFNDSHLYVRGPFEEWASKLDLRPVTSGANVVLAAPFDDGVFDYAQMIDGVRVVSNTQLFLDLYNIHDRARDQAEFLYREVMERGKTQNES
ncbi:MAG: type IV toxin-antitoxin system AbiEi family antitoxin [Elusimicrobiota bacterium]